MRVKSNVADRDKVKALVTSGDVEGVEAAIDKGLLKRKRRKVASVDREKREITFVVTKDSVDRDSERILPGAIEANLSHYLENPVVLFNHDFSIPAVGQMVDYNIGDTEVTMTDRFAPDSHALAKVLWELYSAEDPGPYMRMVSLGYLPIEWSDDAEDILEGQKGLTYLEIEIFEHSFVNVAANRYTLSKAPSIISRDPILRDVYTGIVEEPSKAGEKVGGGSPLSNRTLNISLKGKPLNLKPEEETQMKTKGKQKLRVRLKSEETAEVSLSLAESLDAAIGDGDDREEIIESLAEAAGIEVSDVEAILEGEVEALESACLEDFAAVLDTDADSLMSAAEAEGLIDDSDGSEDAASEGGDDEDAKKSFSASGGLSKEMRTQNAKQKYYSLRGRIKGTLEERCSKVQQAVREYFENDSSELDLNDDDYYYLDLDVIGTEDTKVLFYCWNTGNAYKMDYEMDADGLVELSNLSSIRFTYETVPDDM